MHFACKVTLLSPDLKLFFFRVKVSGGVYAACGTSCRVCSSDGFSADCNVVVVSLGLQQASG